MPDHQKQCRDCGVSFRTEERKRVFRCYSCRQSRTRAIVGIHGAVSRAVKNGILAKQPCEICGAAKVDGHHDDYGKPLSIRWLCRLHHRLHHAEEAKSFRSEDDLLAALRPLTEAARHRVLNYVTERLAAETPTHNGAGSVQ